MSPNISSHGLPSQALDSVFILFSHHFTNEHSGSCNLSSKWVFCAKDIFFTSFILFIPGYELLLETWWVTHPWWSVKISMTLGQFLCQIYLKLIFKNLWCNITEIYIILLPYSDMEEVKDGLQETKLRIIFGLQLIAPHYSLCSL